MIFLRRKEVGRKNAPILVLLGPAQYVEFEELLSASDFIIITVALTETSRGKFNKEVLLKMKKGAILLNISRGVIVNTNDLVEALKSGHLGGAGLDVVDPEPLPSDHPLFSMENVGKHLQPLPVFPSICQSTFFSHYSTHWQCECPLSTSYGRAH